VTGEYLVRYEYLVVAECRALCEYLGTGEYLVLYEYLVVAECLALCEYLLAGECLVLYEYLVRSGHYVPSLAGWL
jgi:hypothetical protein